MPSSGDGFEGDVPGRFASPELLKPHVLIPSRTDHGRINRRQLTEAAAKERLFRCDKAIQACDRRLGQSSSGQSEIVMPRGPVYCADVIRQMSTSSCRSKRTSAGRGLLSVPVVNGNWQRKISPNERLVVVVDGIFRRIVAEELLVCARTPFYVVVVFVHSRGNGKDDDSCPAGLGELVGNVLRNWQNRFGR